MNNKVCIISQAENSYILKVDNKEIQLLHYDSALYFEKLYKRLGYDVVWENNKLKEEK